MIYINGTPTDDTTLPMVLWDNVLSYSTTTLTASSTATGTLVGNVATESTYDYWQPTAIPAWVMADLSATVGGPKDIPYNSVALVAHNLGTTKATVYVQKSSDNITWTTVSNTISPTDDTPILFIFPDTAARYWGIYISAYTGTVLPILGPCILGDRFVFPGGVMPPYTPIWQAQNVELLQAKTLGGQFVGNRVLRKGSETAINLVSVSKTFAESTIQPFKEWYNAGHAFLWASGPSVFTNDLGYVWRKPNAEMEPTFTETGNWVKLTMEVEGYVQ